MKWKITRIFLIVLVLQVRESLLFIPNIFNESVGDFNAEDSEDWYKRLGEFSALDAYKGNRFNLGPLYWICLAHHGELAQFSYNSGKNKKFIDFILLWGLVKESVDDIFLGVDQKNLLDLSQIKTMPAKDLPSDHLPVTIHLKC